MAEQCTNTTKSMALGTLRVFVCPTLWDFHLQNSAPFGRCNPLHFMGNQPPKQRRIVLSPCHFFQFSDRPCIGPPVPMCMEKAMGPLISSPGQVAEVPIRNLRIVSQRALMNSTVQDCEAKYQTWSSQTTHAYRH